MGPYPPGMNKFGGGMGWHSVTYKENVASARKKMAEPIKLPVGMVSRTGGPKKLCNKI